MGKSYRHGEWNKDKYKRDRDIRDIRRQKEKEETHEDSDRLDNDQTRDNYYN